MKSNIKFFKKKKTLPVDKFFKNVLYDKKFGYYSSKQPFGKDGDFVTSPKISHLFSEMIAIWIISTWESFGKPKIFNIVELGPGDGSLTKILLKTFKKFPEFNSKKKIYLYEISDYLKKIQKKDISDKSVKWISNFNQIKNGPIIFFGNEFLDAIPIKQFKRIKNFLYEKNYELDKNFRIKEIYKKATYSDVKKIKQYKTIKNLNFVEFPKLGYQVLDKICKKILKLNGCVLLIDYGYLRSNNQNTLQSVIKHKRNKLLNNLGKADITSHVNFELLQEFFIKNNLRTENIIYQGDFLKNMRIFDRANSIAKKMKFSEQSNIYLRLKRLISGNSMGNLFKVIVAHNMINLNIEGFK